MVVPYFWVAETTTNTEADARTLRCGIANVSIIKNNCCCLPWPIIDMSPNNKTREELALLGWFLVAFRVFRLDSKEDFPLIDNFTLLYLRILDPSANSLSFVYGVYL